MSTVAAKRPGTAQLSSVQGDMTGRTGTGNQRPQSNLNASNSAMGTTQTTFRPQPPYGRPLTADQHMLEIRDHNRYLVKQINHLQDENKHMKETKNIRAKAMVMQRHKNSRYPQYGNLHITPRKREIRCYFGAGSQ